MRHLDRPTAKGEEGGWAAAGRLGGRDLGPLPVCLFAVTVLHDLSSFGCLVACLPVKGAKEKRGPSLTERTTRSN